MNADALKEYGVDYCAGVRRFMDDSELYEEMLREFLSDGSFALMAQAVDAGTTPPHSSRRTRSRAYQAISI